MQNSETKNPFDFYIPYIIAASVVFGIIVFCLFLCTGEKFTNLVTKIMENNPDVPTIELTEKTEKKNIFQKIMSSRITKIPFKINKTIENNYKLVLPNYDDFGFNGKGLVIAASSNKYRYLTGLYSNLYTIRKYHKSNIPIEIFYIGKSEQFSGKIKDLLLSLGNITIHNLLDKIDTNCTEEELRGYQTKPLAVLCSSFEEIILLDADALCFIDPIYFFLAEGYDSNGMILFKDYVNCTSFISKDFMETIGIGTQKYCNYTDDYEIDSSCVIINKRKYWSALYTICIVNVKSESYHASKNVLGDKDTWLIGSMFVGMNPYISKPAPNVIVTGDNKLIVGHLQSSMFKNKEIFTHYNNQKVDLLTAELETWTYAEVKNPKSGEIVNNTLPLSEKIIESFKYAKQAMKILEPVIPSNILHIKSVNGVSKGLIP